MAYLRVYQRLEGMLKPEIHFRWLSIREVMRHVAPLADARTDILQGAKPHVRPVWYYLPELSRGLPLSARAWDADAAENC